MKINEVITVEDFDPYDIYNLAKPEAKEVKRVAKDKQIVEIIRTNCGQMLRACQEANRPLIRGVKGSGMSNVIITGIRPDRKALTISPVNHKKLEDLFNAASLAANRSNSIFCTTDSDFAESWGTPYAIFVKDGWTGTVFETIKTDYAYYKVLSIINSTAPDKDKLKKFKQMKPLVVTPTNLAKVLDDGYKDILITGSSYIGLRLRGDTWKNLRVSLGI